MTCTEDGAQKLIKDRKEMSCMRAQPGGTVLEVSRHIAKPSGVQITNYLALIICSAFCQPFAIC